MSRTTSFKPIRVVFVNRMAGMVRGGGETFDLEVSRHLEALGVEVTYLTGRPFFGEAMTPIEHDRVHYLCTPYSGNLNVYTMRMGWRVRDLDIRLFEWAAYRWLMKHRGEYDVVQVCELTRLVNRWVGRGHAPMVLRMPGPQVYGPVSALRRADVLVASGASMETFREEVREDVLDVPNGVDTELFQPRASVFREEQGISEEAVLVVFVARFVPVKNHALLLGAFKRMLKVVPEARLVLAGSGPEEEAVRSRVQELRLGEQVSFLGEVPYEKVPAIYAAANIKAISSDYESFSFVALEAMASGLSMVVTETEWIPRMMQREKGGVVVPVGDEGAFAEGLVRLALDVALQEQMGHANRARVCADFTWGRSAEVLLGTYRAFFA